MERGRGRERQGIAWRPVDARETERRKSLVYACRCAWWGLCSLRLLASTAARDAASLAPPRLCFSVSW